MQSPAPVDLTGVAETGLWTVYHRAAEAAHHDTVLPDPQAVRLVAQLDFPFRERLGPARSWVSQAIALRALAFDGAVRTFLAAHPDGTVIALGEGLETTFWRVDNGRVQWVSVDLADPLELRTRLLPQERRQVHIPCDISRDPDSRWMESVDTSRGVLVTAQGLLMYLHPSRVRKLIAACAESFPGGTMIFDTVSRRFSARCRAGRKGPGGYRLPPMPWGMDPDGHQKLQAAHPAVTAIRDVPLPVGRGITGHMLSWASGLPLLRNNRPIITSLDFRPSPSRPSA
ncbi:class I SAM-dependent methyltransferase [Streptomyces agglomeratus]|uniref:class I SAM-dependent methyltransferase n=1 Tax=Streptomyces agglomeratus TaxID=285458 RepID=UPI00099FC9E7|nr:class I SAM-dependent methyltransferase [Streptomyces agglomeratus]